MSKKKSKQKVENTVGPVEGPEDDTPVYNRMMAELSGDEPCQLPLWEVAEIAP